MAIDAAFLHKCADPNLKPAIVESFIAAAGSPDPLSVILKSKGPFLLLPRPKTADEALARIRKYVGSTVVRVGITQYPAGLGVKDPSEISADILDACKNVKIGTALFGKVWRIVLKSYGDPADEKLTQQILIDAITAWKTGTFNGETVFTMPDPGEKKLTEAPRVDTAPPSELSLPSKSVEAARDDPNKANIRIDLTGIGGHNP